jgi:hypothetical protein
MTLWARHAPRRPDDDDLIFEEHYAWFVLAADPAVRSVEIRDCDPGPGHVTLVLDGGDCELVARELEDVTPISLVVHVEPRP